MDFDDFETMVCPSCHGAKGIYRIAFDPPDPCDECNAYGYVPNYEKPINKRKTKMNYSSAVMIINHDIRAIRTSYEPGSNGKEPSTFIFKTIDPTIKRGDFVVVPTDTRWGFTVNRVEAVDVDVDFDSDVILKWILSKVDVDGNRQTVAEEEKWVMALQQSEKLKRREALAKQLVETHGDQVKSLMITAGQPVIHGVPQDASNKEGAA